MRFVSKIDAHYISASIKPGVDLTELTDIEIHFIISWFFYHMPMEQRRKLSEEHPVIYKKLVNLDIKKDAPDPDVKPLKV